MSFRHFHHRYWLALVLFPAVLALVACGSVTPVPLEPSLVAPTATLIVPGTPQSPAPSMDGVIPKPVSVVPAGGTFVLSAGAGIYVEPATDEVIAIGQYLADHLNPSTGYSIQVQPATGMPPAGSILLSLGDAGQELGDEGYKLIITPALVRLVANQPAGLFHGTQTIRQLLPADIDAASLQPGPWALGTGTITDYPRFAWRGTMLDVARHFFSVRDVTHYIDLLAYYKLNYFHLHLSDDQGWRIQIKSWPNLALYGGSLEVGNVPGGYFSQDDYTYIVNYARSRYITIVPEIDMPGHITAALASYAELNCNGIAPDLFTDTQVGFSSICVQKDVTNTFVKDVIGELAALTPGPYIHIGGDEAGATEMPDYIDFVQRAQAVVAVNGKKTIGWEEIARARLLPSSIVQYGIPGQSMAKQIVRQGAKVIMSTADRAYLDMKYDPNTPLGQIWAGYINLEKGYSWDPATVIPGLTENNILGVEAPLWSETLVTLADVEYMAFPRLLGYAEMSWTPQAGRTWHEYKTRLAAQGPRLEALGIHFYRSPEINWP